MRKSKVTKIEVLTKILEISKEFIFDLLIELYSIENIKKLAIKYNLTDARNEHDKVYDYFLTIAHAIFNKGNRELLDEIIRYNNSSVERNNFQKMTFEELEFEYSKKITYHEAFKASPELVIFYYYSKGAYKNEICLKSINYYYDRIKKDQEIWKKQELKEIGDTLKSFRNKLDEIEKEELESYLKEDYESIDEIALEKVKSEFECTYNKEKDCFDNVNKNFLVWVHRKIITYEIERQSLEQCVSVAYNICKQAYKNIEFANKYITQFSKMKEKIRELDLKNRKLKKDLSSIKSIEKDKSSKDIKIFEKENYYLKNEVEKLQERISVLEEEEKIKTEIVEQLEVEETIHEIIEAPQMFDIVVLGGKWNSGNSEDVENFFWENGSSEVEFLDADKLIRNEYKIKNADIVIFDTSFNSHKMFYKYRKDIDFIISKSNLKEIEKIFKNI